MTNTAHRFSLLDYIEVFLFACILNLNAIRIVVNKSGEILTYVIFLSFSIVVAVNCIMRNNGVLKVNKHIAIVLSIFLLYCVLSSFWTENSFPKLIKLISGLIIAYLSSLFDNQKREKSIHFSIIISTLYGIYLIFNTNKIISFVRLRIFNYIDATLSLGLGLSFLLAILFLSKPTKLNTVFVLLSAAVHAYAMTKLFARGNLLFPVVITIVLILYKNRTSIKTIMISVLAISFLLASSYYVIVTFANERLLQRLTNLFVSFGEEDRIGIYLYYIKYILHAFAYVFGIGFRASAEVLREGGFTVSYPHNFVLELVGELGLVGIFTIGAFGIMLYRNIAMQYGFFRNNKQTDDAQEQMLFYLTLSGFLFYFLSFLKSYSIYDGYQFFIFISLIIHPDRRWLSAYKNAAQV